jgi:hypothetical protein
MLSVFPTQCVRRREDNLSVMGLYDLTEGASDSFVWVEAPKNSL